MAKIDNRYEPYPKPTLQQIREFAHVLAVDQGVIEKQYIDLLYWPRCGTPCMTVGKWWLEWAEDLKEYARTALTDRMACGKRKRIKRRKKIKKPNKTKFWTRRQLKHGQTPPARRRGFLTRPPQTAHPPPAPPGMPEPRHEELSASRPSRRIRRELLFETPGISRRLIRGDSQTLFDNRIAVCFPNAVQSATA